MSLSLGSRLGPYQVTALIGQGGMIALINPGNPPQEGPCAGLRRRAARRAGRCFRNQLLASSP